MSGLIDGKQRRRRWADHKLRVGLSLEMLRDRNLVFLTTQVAPPGPQVEMLAAFDVFSVFMEWHKFWNTK